MKTPLSVDLSPDTTLGTNFPRRYRDGEIGVDLNRDLNLATLLDAADGGLSESRANLPHLLALLLFLLIVGEVRVVVGLIVVDVLDLGSLGVAVLLGRLGLGLDNVDVGVALDNLDEDIAAVLGSRNVNCSPSGDGSLGGHDGHERLLAAGRKGNDANGVGDVGNGGNGGVGRLVDVLGLVLLDQAGLESGTAGLELGGVDGGRARGGRQDGGGLGEDVAKVGSDAGGVGGAAGEDNLIDIEHIEAGLLDDRLDQAGEALKNGAGNGLITQAVDGAGKVNALRQALNAEAGVGANAESLLGSLGLELQLGQTPGVLPGVGTGVLLHELLGEVVDQNLIERSAGELVVVSSGENGIHAAAAGDNGNVRAGTTEVGNDNDFVRDLGLRARIISENGSDGLADQLKDLEVGGVGGGDKGSLLLVGEVGRDGDDSGGDFLAQVFGGGADQTADIAGRDLVNGKLGGGGLLICGVLNGERDNTISLLGVSGSVVVGGIYRLKVLAEEVAEVGDGVLGIPDKESLGLLAVVLLAVNVRQNGGDLAVYASPCKSALRWGWTC